MADTDGGEGRGRIADKKDRFLALKTHCFRGRRRTRDELPIPQISRPIRNRSIFHFQTTLRYTLFFRGGEEASSEEAQCTNVRREKFVVRRGGRGGGRVEGSDSESKKLLGESWWKILSILSRRDFDGTVNNRYRLATGNSLIYGRIGNRGGQTQRLTLKYFIRGS